MKNILYILALFTFTSNFAQTSIRPIENKWGTGIALPHNVYFKDVNNELDKFIGTWKYEDALAEVVFEITFTKLLNITVRNNTQDELQGQFKLMINGVEQYNTYTTICQDCCIASGFLDQTHWDGTTGDTVVIPPNINTYFLAVAEPAIEDDVEASTVKMVYQYTSFTNTHKIYWTNTVEQVTEYVSGAVVNNYQMPYNMTLIKQ